MVEEAPRPAAPDESEQPASEVAAWTVLSYVITGPLLYGGLGYLLDRWLGTRFLVAVGLVGGMALAIYLVTVRYRTR
jgi:ATP synthase protein I